MENEFQKTLKETPISSELIFMNKRDTEKLWRIKLTRPYIKEITSIVNSWRASTCPECPIKCKSNRYCEGIDCDILTIEKSYELSRMNDAIDSVNVTIFREFARYSKEGPVTFDHLMKCCLELNIKRDALIEALTSDQPLSELLVLYRALKSIILKVRDFMTDPKMQYEDRNEDSNHGMSEMYFNFISSGKDSSSQNVYGSLLRNLLPDSNCPMKKEVSSNFSYTEMNCCVCQLILRRNPMCFEKCCNYYSTDIIGLLNIKGITPRKFPLSEFFEYPIQCNIFTVLKFGWDKIDVLSQNCRSKTDSEIIRYLAKEASVTEEVFAKRVDKLLYNESYGKLIQQLKRAAKNADYDISDIFTPQRVTHYDTNDGHVVDSSYEVIVDNVLSEKQVPHFIPKQFQAPSIPFYGGDNKFRPDFVLQDCYIEVAGLTEWNLSNYREKMNQKAKFAKELGIKLVVLTPKKNSNKEGYFEISGNYQPKGLIGVLADLRF